MKHWKDKTGELQRYVDFWMSRDPDTFKHLKLYELRILMCFRDEHDLSDEGQPILAKACKLGGRERDVFGFDFMIVVAADTWRELTKKQKARLIWHEMLHLQIVLDDDGKPKLDKEDRIVLRLLKHDLVIRSFRDEIIKFGLQAEYVPLAEFLAEALAERRRAKEAA